MPCPQANPRPRVARPNLSGEPYRPGVSPRSLDSAAVSALVASITTGEEPDRTALRDAVRALLDELRRRAPGRTVEVRVPPFGAIQCVAGPTHTRGTPPNVIETDPVTFLLLATGRLRWADAVQRRAGVGERSPGGSDPVPAADRPDRRVRRRQLVDYRRFIQGAVFRAGCRLHDHLHRANACHAECSGREPQRDTP